MLLLNSGQPIQLPLLGSRIPVIKEADGTVFPGDQDANSLYAQLTKTRDPAGMLLQTNLKTPFPHFWQPRSTSLLSFSLSEGPASSDQSRPLLCLSRVQFWGCFSAQLHRPGMLVVFLCQQPSPAAQNQTAHRQSGLLAAAPVQILAAVGSASSYQRLLQTFTDLDQSKTPGFCLRKQSVQKLVAHRETRITRQTSLQTPGQELRVRHPPCTYYRLPLSWLDHRDAVWDPAVQVAAASFASNPSQASSTYRLLESGEKKSDVKLH